MLKYKINNVGIEETKPEGIHALSFIRPPTPVCRDMDNGKACIFTLRFFFFLLFGMVFAFHLAIFYYSSTYLRRRNGFSE